MLYRICESLGKQHRAMDEGRIVRLGRSLMQKLSSEYDAFVTVDGIVERRSADLKVRLTRVQEEIARIDAISPSQSNLDRFNHLDNAQRALDFCLDATNKVARSGNELNAQFQSVVTRLRARR